MVAKNSSPLWEVIKTALVIGLVIALFLSPHNIYSFLSKFIDGVEELILRTMPFFADILEHAEGFVMSVVTYLVVAGTALILLCFGLIFAIIFYPIAWLAKSYILAILLSVFIFRRREVIFDSLVFLLTKYPQSRNTKTTSSSKNSMSNFLQLEKYKNNGGFDMEKDKKQPLGQVIPIQSEVIFPGQENNVIPEKNLLQTIIENNTGWAYWDWRRAKAVKKVANAQADALMEVRRLLDEQVKITETSTLHEIMRTQNQIEKKKQEIGLKKLGYEERIMDENISLQELQIKVDKAILRSRLDEFENQGKKLDPVDQEKQKIELESYKIKEFFRLRAELLQLQCNEIQQIHDNPKLTREEKKDRIEGIEDFYISKINQLGRE